MNFPIQIGPNDYMLKLKEHTAAVVIAAKAKLKSAQDLVIQSADDLRNAKQDHVNWRDDLKALEEDRKEITVPINAVLDAVNAEFKVPAEILKEARLTTERKAVAYEAKIEAERKEAERKAIEAARKEEERIRKEKEAQERAWREKEEAARKEAEDLARKAAETKNAEKRAEIEAQEEKARQEAARAKDKADERAEQAAQAFVVPEAVQDQERVKVAGAKDRTLWFAKVVDSKLVPVEWAGRELRPVDEGIINGIARSLKTDKSPIPGVRFYSEKKL